MSTIGSPYQDLLYQEERVMQSPGGQLLASRQPTYLGTAVEPCLFLLGWPQSLLTISTKQYKLGIKMATPMKKAVKM